MRHLLDLSKDELSAWLGAHGEPHYRTRQIARWALLRGVTDFEAMTDVPAGLRASLAAEFTLAPLPVLATRTADDGDTTKVLLDLGGDGQAVEAVRMSYDPDEDGVPDQIGRASCRERV